MKKSFLSRWILPSIFPNPYQQVRTNENLLHKAKLKVVNSKGIQSIFSVSDKIRFRLKGEYRYQSGKIVGLGQDFLLVRDRKTLKKIYLKQVNNIGKQVVDWFNFSKMLNINSRNQMMIQKF